jgi:hypothetical protein
MVDTQLHSALAESPARLARMLSTRTLQHFAEEARLDGESLREAVDRYDIDYAWHVLGASRTHDAAVAGLEARLQRTLTEEERNQVAGALKSTAAMLEPDLLMSFDNDVAQHVTELMADAWDAAPSATSPATDLT